jgi:nitric oxide reductase NorD protein
LSDRRLFEHELAERLDTLLFASPSHRSVKKLAAVIESLPRRHQEVALHWAGVAAQTDAEMGFVIVLLAPQVLERFGEDGFEAWVRAGLDTYDKAGLCAATQGMRDLEGFSALCAGQIPVPLAEVEQRLMRLVQALSGKTHAVKVGAYPWTDGEHFYLPGQLGHFPVSEDNQRLYVALTVHLWAQLDYGTFAVDLDAELARWPEREMALTWLAHLEAVRLEACIARDLPGLGRLLTTLRDAWPAELADAIPALQGAAADVRTTLQWLARLMARSAVPPAPTFCGRIDPAGLKRGKEKPVVESAGLAVPVSLLGKGMLDVPQTDMAAMLTAAGEGAWVPTERTGEGPEVSGNRQADFIYDEWDMHRQAYRRSWCHVYEATVAPGEGDFVRETAHRHAPFIRQLRRRFEAVRGEERTLGRQPEGEEIDLDALVEAVNDRRAGAEPSPRLFCRRVRNERSLAAMFMIDMSGSTKGWVNDAEREALVMLCEALEQLGDAYAIYGFSGWTRTRCDIYRIKDFADRYNDVVRARIDAIEAKDYTRMGVAIRHLSSLLSQQPARHQLLVTLSDGRPDDFGDEYRGAYGIEDTRRAFQEARRQGIRSYCITIDRHGADYLKHMVGPAGYTVLDDVKQLPLKVADIYRRLTA